ncbi:60S ribosomal export protein NMD3 [Candidatus Micrarchaeota archaeon]|nr:60S ribosomal export protein NMD3 [Candidatus Micrarchaeota archaeon]
MKVCPRCGKTSEQVDFIDSLCVECYEPDFKVPTKIKITTGKETGKLLYKNQWIPYTDDNIKKVIESHIKGDFEDIEYDLDHNKLTVFIKVGNTLRPFERYVVFQIRRILEPHIAQLRAGYYEGIVQIRGNPQKIPWWRNRLVSFLERHKVGISNEKELKEGIDLYVTDKKKMPEIFHDLNLKFLRTNTLYGLKDGKRIYRDTFLIRVGEKK